MEDHTGTINSAVRAQFMRWGSYGTALTSLALSVSYATHPAAIARSWFAVLTPVHWFWAFLQLALGVGIFIAQRRGNRHIQVAHVIGFTVQSVYAVEWLGTAITTNAGWFVAPLVAFLAFVHYILSKLTWPNRGEERP